MFIWEKDLAIPFVSYLISPHKGQWRGALMFSLNCAWTNGWANNRDAGDLRRHRAHYDVTIMLVPYFYAWQGLYQYFRPLLIPSVIMMVADVLAPIRRHAISDHHVDSTLTTVSHKSSRGLFVVFSQLQDSVQRMAATIGVVRLLRAITCNYWRYRLSKSTARLSPGDDWMGSGNKWSFLGYSLWCCGDFQLAILGSLYRQFKVRTGWRVGNNLIPGDLFFFGW